jgi:energy-coupling factor transporter ATP-binding protein EcfA2
MLSAADRLKPHPARVAIAGAPGAGKTTLARRLAPLLRAEAVELDELAHGPGWTIRAGFAGEVDAFTRRDRWITEWQFDEARPLIAARADTLVWLDLPTRVVMRRLVRRTVADRRSKRELWAGNVEPPLWTVLVEPNHMIRWGYRSIGLVRQQVLAAEREYPRLRVVRLRSQADVDAFVAAAASGPDN